MTNNINRGLERRPNEDITVFSKKTIILLLMSDFVVYL